MRTKNLTKEEISFRGRIAALMIILASGDFIDNRSEDVLNSARSLAEIKNGNKLTKPEKGLSKELAYLGMVGLADAAKKFFSNDNNSVNTFIGNAAIVLKTSWPNHRATKRYFSEKINSREMLYKRVTESFVKTYKDKSVIPPEELKRRADQILAEQIVGASRQAVESILSATNEEIQTIAKNLNG